MENATCVINANPDIAGIGIRISLYLQALLAVTCAMILIMAQVGDNNTNRLPANLPGPKTKMKSLSATALATGISLIIAAFITARTSGLTVYHGLLVLNLCWISNITVLIIFSAAPTIVGQLILAVVQLCGTGALGIWLFARIDSFGSQPECTPTTVYSMAQHYVRVDNPHFRKFWLAIYIIAAIPYLNLLIFRWLGTSLTYCAAGCIGRSAVVLIPVAPIVALIFSTERTITHNIVGPGEHDWGFGQTLALVLVIIPLRDVVNVWLTRNK